MSSPSSTTFPAIHAPGMVSCIRLIVRRNVDLPHPDGPISACTWLDANDSDTSFTAANSPYIALNASVRTRGVCWRVALPIGGCVGSRIASDIATQPLPGDDARNDTEREHHEDQHQRCRPGQLVPLGVRPRG